MEVKIHNNNQKKMKRIKIALMVALAAIAFNTTNAQGVAEGKKFFYYERYQSAKELFKKLSATDPNSEEYAYYYGHAMLDLEDYTGAREAFRGFLEKHPNSPMIIAAMGHLDLIEGKKADARSRFETAISLTKGQNARVLNAVGHANSNTDMKNGDAQFAIDVLKKAAALKDGAKDPEIWTNLGDAYRKLYDGTNAYQAYNQALALDPNYARAIYRTGRIYQTQGKSQEVIYMKYYNDAIAKDPNYGPVYATLMNYYYETDISKSAEYMDKWLKVSDDDPKACYYRAGMKYRQGLFAESVAMADQCIAAEGQKPYPNLFGLKALAYDRLKDSLSAKNMYEEYFKRQIEENIGSGDYAAYAKLLLKFPGNEALAAQYIDKAVALDTIESNKVSYIKQMAKVYEEKKDFKTASDWYSKVLDVKKSYSNVDIHNAGYGYFRSGNYVDAAKCYEKYTAKYPEDIFGHYMLAKSNGALDSGNVKGMAIPSYTRVVEIGEKEADKSKVANQLSGAYKFFVEYYYNAKKDQATALQYIDKAIALEPTDAQLQANKEFISKNDPAKVRPAARPATPRQPAAPKAPAKPGTKTTSTVKANKTAVAKN